MDFTITSQTMKSQFNYKDVIIVQGEYQKNAIDNSLQSVNGACYTKNANGDIGESIGNFNGYSQADGTIKYDISRVDRSNASLVLDAIGAIEAQITGAQE